MAYRPSVVSVEPSREHLARLLDALIAAAFLAVAQWAVWGQRTVQGDRWFDCVVLGLVAPPLYWRRSRPTTAVAVSAGAMTLQALVTRAAPDGLLYTGPALVGSYSLGAFARPSRAWLGLCVYTVAFTVQFAFDADASSTSEELWAGLFWFAVMMAAWLTGRYVRSRRELDAQRRAEQLRSRAEEAAVAAERRQIARELHDVLAHSVSLMGVQAAAAERVMAVDPERARDVLTSVQRISRESVGELRRLLAVLRRSDEVPLEPQPGLADLGELVRRADEAGVPTTLHVRGDPRQLGPGLELCVYRVVQEALTNATRHMRDPRAAVDLVCDGGSLRLAIDSQGAISPEPGTGHGLVGIRERVAIYGGEVESGQVAPDRFVVHVRLPLGTPTP